MIWHLELGADPNVPSRRGYTPLDSAPLTSSLNTVKNLVSYGGNLQDTMAMVTTASRYDLAPVVFETMAFLIDQGADIDRVEKDHLEPLAMTVYAGTALHRAVDGEDAERVRFLLQKGANRHVKGLKGLSALEVAAMRGLTEMAHILRTEYTPPVRALL